MFVMIIFYRNRRNGSDNMNHIKKKKLIVWNMGNYENDVGKEDNYKIDGINQGSGR